jgi:hypothetical protein
MSLRGVNPIEIRNEKDMKHLLAGLKIIGPFALLVAGFCSCTSTEVEKSSAEKEREAWYSNYVDNTDKVWGEHL